MPDASARFKGTYREDGWRRCAQMSAGDGIRFTPWPHEGFAAWSLPALEAAKCAAKQGDELFARVHLDLYRAFFTESRNISVTEHGVRSIPTVIVAETGRALVGLADYDVYREAVEEALA